jgi:hypothetical protein
MKMVKRKWTSRKGGEKDDCDTHHSRRRMSVVWRCVPGGIDRHT